MRTGNARRCRCCGGQPECWSLCPRGAPRIMKRRRYAATRVRERGRPLKCGDGTEMASRFLLRGAVLNVPWRRALPHRRRRGCCRHSLARRYGQAGVERARHGVARLLPVHEIWLFIAARGDMAKRGEAMTLLMTAMPGGYAAARKRSSAQRLYARREEFSTAHTVPQ